MNKKIIIGNFKMNLLPNEVVLYIENLKKDIKSNNKIKKIKDKEIFLWTIHNNNELEEIKNKFSNIDDYYIIKDKKE